MIFPARQICVSFLLCLAFGLYPATPSGIEDIDRVRSEVTASSTTAANARARHAVLYSWYRLLLHQGIDLRAFEPVRAKLGQGQLIEPVFRAIDEGFAILQRIQDNPTRIAEVRGKGSMDSSGSKPTDWPVYNGGPAQTGYSPDPGAGRGEVAWRFPVGHSWYARPAVENGRVYIASPGMTTLLYCLDEESGRVIWRTRQDGINLYGTPRAASGVVIMKDMVAVRATTGSWEDQPARHLFYINKETGKAVKQEDAGMVDYRRGYPPLAGNGKYLVYAHGRQDIRSMPPSVWMLDTVVTREVSTGRIWWTLRVGDIFGDPVLDGGQVYVATESGTLFSLNLEGGERVRWSFQAKAPLRGTPVVAGDLVLAAANDGSVYAVGKEDGRMRWTWTAAEKETRAFLLYSTPTVANGRVYIGSASKYLYCLDANTGKLIWKQRVNDWVRSRPVVVGRTVYVAAMDGTVWALEDGGTSAKVLWREKAGEHQVFADLAAGENSVLVSSSGLFLYSLDLKSGRSRWHQSLLEGVQKDGEWIPADVIAAGSDYQSPPTAARGRVFVGAPDRFVHALDAATGKEVWRFETTGQVSGSPTVAEGRVFFGQQGGDKDFYAVDEKDGRLVWKRAVGWAWVTAGYSDGKLYVGTVEGDIICLRAADGDILWTHRTNGGVYPAPATDEDSVYTGSWDGYYYALDKNTGRLRWAFARPGWPYERGGGPDSAAPVIWQGNVLARIVPSTLAAIDKATGKLVWEFRGPQYHGINATAAAHGDRIFISVFRDVGSANIGAHLFALDNSGKQVWEYRGAGGWPGAVIARDKVCTGSSTEPFFVCLDPKGNGDGTTNVLWRTKVGAVFEESVPAVYGDKLFVLCSDRYFYAFQ